MIPRETKLSIDLYLNRSQHPNFLGDQPVVDASASLALTEPQLAQPFGAPVPPAGITLGLSKNDSPGDL